MEPGANSSPSEMEIAQALAMDEPAEAEAASALASAWEWGSLLDFSIEDDDSFVLSWPGSDPTSQMPSPRPDPTPPPPPLPPQLTAAKTPRRVRKRDPRLVCENYLAGRVPCACPELDEKEGEDPEVAEVLTGGRKRGRVGGATAAVMGGVRCQVLGCEADITELKGYHRRHRVCLRCASASSVLIDGEHKRYCQQCGKFHVLPDFDEGKRSCRRKLERHNKRRRRRPTDRRSVVEEEKEHKKDLLVDISSDGEPAKVETVVSNKVMDKEALLESENGHESPVSSLPSFQNVQSHVGVSFTSSGNAQIDERVDNPKSALSSTFYDNKSVYSSVCPTGRISFKLYDWNPAEFPRRLRHQIFQWLASMPVELEGYIRPGCTILTIFIAMPQFMWDKLSQEMAVYVRDLVNAPESLFVGRGKFFIYLSNMIVQVMRDGTSLMNVKMEVQVPKLHYVYPTYFEAGKCMEFVVCGSNLSQPKFRFLVSFSGKYLVYDSCCAISHRETMSYNGNGRGFVHNSEHEMFRIIITHTEADVFGPAFIEVENESGISNFIPILVGGKHVCSELERMQVAFDKSICEKSIVSQISVSGACPSLCELFESKQTATSELLLDIAWLLKKPRLDENGTIVSLHNFQRLTSLVEFLMQNEFVNILEEILHCLDIKIDEQAFGGLLNKTADIDLTLLQSKMNHAREIVNKKAQHDLRSELGLRNSIHGVSISHGHTESNKICTLPFTGPDGERSKEDDSGLISTPIYHGNDGKTGDFGHRRHCFTNLGVKWHRESWGDHLPSTIMRTRLSVFVLVGVVMCFGACIVFFHPRKAAEFAVTIRRCMFNGTML